MGFARARHLRPPSPLATEIRDAFNVDSLLSSASAAGATSGTRSTNKQRTGSSSRHEIIGASFGLTSQFTIQPQWKLAVILIAVAFGGYLGWNLCLQIPSRGSSVAKG